MTPKIGAGDELGDFFLGGMYHHVKLLYTCPCLFSTAYFYWPLHNEIHNASVMMIPAAATIIPNRLKIKSPNLNSRT